MWQQVFWCQCWYPVILFSDLRKGCRPKTCIHGRTSTGYCRSTPVCQAGYQYYSKYGGCRPKTCANGRSSTGWCRACPSPTQYHDGDACVEKTVPAPEDPQCPAGQLWYGYWSGCRPKTCDYGRYMSTGWCKPPPPRLPKPGGLTADGDNRSWYETYRSFTIYTPSTLPDDEYHAYVSWPKVPSAEEYSLRYAVWRLSTGTTVDLLVPSLDWQYVSDSIDNPTTGSVTFTLEGLERNQLYAISVQARASNRTDSLWSEPVYVYPTALVPAGTGDRIGILPVSFYITDKSYDYVICTNRAPTGFTSGDLSWTVPLKKAVNRWGTSTGGAVTMTATVRTCVDTDTGHEFANETFHNVVKIATKEDILEMGCRKPRAAGCILAWATSEGADVATRIGVLASASFKERNGCSEVIRIMLHEAGHAYGLLHTVALHHRSLMRPTVSNAALCDLYEYDKVAIKAIYQSRTVPPS